MAQIDIREATIKIFDGTLNTATLNFTAAEADLVLTAKSKHIGSDKISITILAPAVAGSLNIDVDGREITVTLAATGETPTITTTALLLKAGIEADPEANALVSVALAPDEDGSGLLNALTKTVLTGQNSITVKIGEGNLTYSEKRPVEFTRDRGRLESVKLADEEPMDLSFDIMWEWITSETGGTPTVEDVLKKVNEAADWLTTADDDCQPDCVDVELWNAPGCGSLEDEILMFEEFYYETCDHDLREGTASVAGRCNRVCAIPYRVANANIEG